MCVCVDAKSAEDDDSLEVLAKLREDCAALRMIVPDQIWGDFKTSQAVPDPVAHHRSIVLLALERGHLKRVTGPIHQYLLDADHIRPNVANQYVQDLRERWMQYEDPV